MRKIIIGISLLVIAVVVGACGSNGGDSEGDARFPIEITSERVESGAAIYAVNCASCHGPVNGPPAIGIAPVHGSAGHTWHHPDRLLFDWTLDRPPLATFMPAFRGQLTEEEVLDVLAYIKSNWDSDKQQQQREGSVQYEAQIIEFGTE